MDDPGRPAPRSPAVPAEDRTYLGFMAASLGVALGAGLVLAVLLAVTTSRGPNQARLVQAHGWAQLQGWLGIFVAGMGLRLIPRLCGRRPLPRALTLAVLFLLTAGVIGRVIAQTVDRVPWLFLSAALLAASGMFLVAFGLLFTLARSHRRGQDWRWPAWAAAAWWALWAGLTVAAGLEGAGNGGLVPAGLDEPSTWVVLLGPLLNLVWAVQARSVPVFFGRRPPRRTLVPTALFNLGVFLVLLSVSGQAAVGRIGLGLAGAATVWLTPLAGAIWGQAHRLTVASRPAARFVLTANRWGLLAGASLLVGAALPPGLAVWTERLDTGALHLLGLGLATLLIVGMSRLVAPVFAIQRSAPRRERGPAVILALLVGATGARWVAALLDGSVPEAWITGLLGIAGVLAWLGLALFAASLAVAWRDLDRQKAVLVRSARHRP
jgi:hypothetical protein